MARDRRQGLRESPRQRKELLEGIRTTAHLRKVSDDGGRAARRLGLGLDLRRPVVTSLSRADSRHEDTERPPDRAQCALVARAELVVRLGVEIPSHQRAETADLAAELEHGEAGAGRLGVGRGLLI